MATSPNPAETACVLASPGLEVVEMPGVARLVRGRTAEFRDQVIAVGDALGTIFAATFRRGPDMPWPGIEG